MSSISAASDARRIEPAGIGLDALIAVPQASNFDSPGFNRRPGQDYRVHCAAMSNGVAPVWSNQLAVDEAAAMVPRRTDGK